MELKYLYSHRKKWSCVACFNKDGHAIERMENPGDLAVILPLLGDGLNQVVIHEYRGGAESTKIGGKNHGQWGYEGQWEWMVAAAHKWWKDGGALEGPADKPCYLCGEPVGAMWEFDQICKPCWVSETENRCNICHEPLHPRELTREKKCAECLELMEKTTGQLTLWMDFSIA